MGTKATINADRLVMQSVMGEIHHPTMSQVYRLDTMGKGHTLPSVGGIVYNVKIGDSVYGMECDHVEPGVSTKHRDENINRAYNTYSCIGNEAVIVSGEAKGSKGFVTGKHGGAEHVMIYFDNATLEKMTHDDKIMIKTCGQGMELLDHPEIALRSVSPTLLDKMNITEDGDCLKVGVAKMVPAKVMGSGIGYVPTHSSDYDITLFDAVAAKEYGLCDLRFGDIVAITDADNRYGRTYQAGAVTIGVVVHSDCIIPGHGPGVTTLMSALDGKIVPFIDSKANLADLFL